MTDGFKIIGIATRTTNKDNQAQQDLEQLWGAFFANNLVEQIPNQVSNEILAIYTDYESDYTEAYTTIIGMRVSTLDEVPEGLLGRAFEAATFEKFTAKGTMPQAVVATWMSIWQRDKELQRAYSYDFEVYGAAAQQGAQSEVPIYIATK